MQAKCCKSAQKRLRAMKSFVKQMKEKKEWLHLKSKDLKK